MNNGHAHLGQGRDKEKKPPLFGVVRAQSHCVWFIAYSALRLKGGRSICTPGCAMLTFLHEGKKGSPRRHAGGGPHPDQQGGRPADPAELSPSVSRCGNPIMSGVRKVKCGCRKISLQRSAISCWFSLAADG